MTRVLITGANRGLGLAFAIESLARGNRIFATCRQPDEAEELQALAGDYPGQFTILRLDVTKGDTIKAAVRAVRRQEGALDLLINNAGVSPSGERLGNLDAETMVHTFHVNSVGPALVAQGFLELLQAGADAKILNISSQLGSLNRKSSGGRYSYCSSKAALNMLTRALAFELASDGIIVVSIHPGWVRTDMGGDGAPLSPEESVRAVMDLAQDLTAGDTGSFYSYAGGELPW